MVKKSGRKSKFTITCMQKTKKIVACYRMGAINHHVILAIKLIFHKLCVA